MAVTVVDTDAAHRPSVVLGAALPAPDPPITAIENIFAPTPSYVVPAVADTTFTAAVVGGVIVGAPGRVDDVEMVPACPVPELEDEIETEVSVLAPLVRGRAWVPVEQVTRSLCQVVDDGMKTTMGLEAAVLARVLYLWRRARGWLPRPLPR